MGIRYNPITGKVESLELMENTANSVEKVNNNLSNEDSEGKKEDSFGKKIPMLSPSGEAVWVEDKDYEHYVFQGYKYESPQEEAKRKELEWAKEQDLLAGGLAAARTATFGLSDLGARALGLQDKVKLLKNENPIASDFGEIGGVLATLGIGAAGAVTKGAMKLTSPITNKIIQRIAASGVEGAAYGLGVGISEQALDETDDSIAESLLYNAGLGFVFGSGMHGLIEGSSYLIGKGKDKITSKVKDLFKEKLKKIDTAEEGSLINEVNDFLQIGKKEMKLNVNDIKAAAYDLGVEPTPAMLSSKDFIQKTEQSGIEGAGLVWEPIRKQRQDIYQKSSKVLKESLDGAANETKFEIGESVKKFFLDILDDIIAATESAYSKVSPDFKKISLPEKSKLSYIKRFRDNPYNAIEGSAIAGHYKQIAGSLERAQTLEQLKLVISDVGERINTAKVSGAGETMRELISIQNKLKTFEENSIKRAAVDNARNSKEGMEVFKEFYNDLKAAKAENRNLYSVIESIKEASGIKKRMTPRLFKEMIDDLDGAELVNKLWKENNVTKMRGLSEMFPEQFQKLASLRKQDILQKSMDGDMLSIGKFLRETDKMSPEFKTMLFGENGVRNIKSVRTLFRANPKVLNPSGTQVMRSFQELINPIYQGSELIRYMTYKGLPTISQTMQKENTQVLKGVISFVNKSKKAIEKAAGTAAHGTKITGTIIGIKEARENYKKQYKQTKDMLEDPYKMIEQINESTNGIDRYSPQLRQNIIMKSLNAAAFLAERMPKPENDISVLKQKEYAPSDSELMKFQRYLKAVQEPMSVLDELNEGVLTREGVETLEAVYPSLLNKMRTNLLNKAIENPDNFTYAQRLQMSIFLGSPTEYATSNDFIFKMQKYAKTAPENEPGTKGNANLTMATNILSKYQQIENKGEF